MINRHTAKKIRKTHRYLGLFIGIQFLMWTISGLYFSWTDLDEIHGDQFLRAKVEKATFSDLLSPSELKLNSKIASLELIQIGEKPFYWINNTILFDATDGTKIEGISQKDALAVASQHVLNELEVLNIEKISNTDNHHEYRGKPLPAYVISYNSSDNIKAYVAVENGKFESIRHRDWRWFDFLWMTHTMDYDGRDDFNNIILRAFSLLGLLTVLSGFTLWYTSSPSIRKILNRKKKKNK
ncbi:PepSY domain-containing protein [Gillisia sp. CAL575]|uniref:PepSY domain-containing protein n=1 Tax=Gillisia sp. CAL575 TaxID=985255 RepID=UPI0003A3A448|nr:PepSY domain-containing protein [Gillisia sp. CAL575]